MGRNLYEFVPYKQTNYLYQMGELNYCLPHIHKEYEFGIVLGGQMHINPKKENIIINPGEFWLINPYQCHEFSAKTSQDTFLFLEVQFSKSFFKSYFPQISNLYFDNFRITEDMIGAENFNRLKTLLLQSATSYFKREKGYELACAGDLNHILCELFLHLPYHTLSLEEQRTENYRIQRMERILAYIEEHFSEKLLLSDLAKKENLTMNYLSHIFKEAFGLPFQNYVQNVRCHRAAVMLLETDHSATEISSSCGFSALKYMKQAFSEIFHMTPWEFRRQGYDNVAFVDYLKKELKHETNYISMERTGIIQTRRALPKTFSSEESLRRILEFTC